MTKGDFNNEAVRYMVTALEKGREPATIFVHLLIVLDSLLDRVACCERQQGRRTL